MRHVSKAALLAFSAFALTAPVQAQQAATALPRENFDYTGWDAYLGGAESAQYSALEQINKGNVGRLQVAWEYPAGDGAAPQFNPLVVNGTMYVQRGDGKLAALDPATGRISTRGINYWQSRDGSDRRLVFLNDGLLRAIDARTGKYIPNFSVDLRDALPEGHAPTPRPLMTSNPGRVFEDTFIVSLPAGGGFASHPANIQAYNIRTGALKWSFNVVPRIGEFGSDTWPEKDRELFGGVHNWSEFTVDPELGIVFVPTGTARSDFYGGNRPGNNLFANSILALDARTGKRIWHFQTVHHDLWDFDLPNAPKLMTITKDGKKIPVVIVAAKHGFVFVFDRRTGEPVWPIEERPVPQSDVPGEETSPTQPFPTWPQPFVRSTFSEADINPYLTPEDQEKVRQILRSSRNEGLFTPPSLRGSISIPGHNGGANWGNSAVDPARQRFFVVSRETPVLIKLVPPNPAAAKPVIPNGDEHDVNYGSPYDFMRQSNGMVAIKPPFSFLTAYDMNTGNMLWRIPNGTSWPIREQGVTEDVGSQAPRGGPVTTKSGLLFVGTAGDRMFRARDQDTGKVLWQHQLDAATEGVPAVYEIAGRQYVTIPVGGEGLHPQNGAPKPGPNRYITFALPAR